MAERAGPRWAGRALGVQNTFQNVIATLVATPLALLISAAGGGATGYAACVRSCRGIPVRGLLRSIPAASERSPGALLDESARVERPMSDPTPDSARPRTIVDKIWDEHLVAPGTDGAPDVLGIDLHLVHEVTSPQAFDGLRDRGLRVRRPGQTLATVDHIIPDDGPLASLRRRDRVRPRSAASSRTAASSAFRCTASARRTRGSSTSSVPSWG